jgi:Asp-tRNA(Asn)/Glu-tRNA(Gln) amidotransferase B subunit
MEDYKEKEPNRETTDGPLELLLVQLDFHESPRLAQAREIILLAYDTESTDDERMQALWAEYSDAGQAIADSFETTPDARQPRTKLQIALAIHKAHILHEIGRISGYIEELDIAETLAYTGGFEDITVTLQKKLTSTIDASGLTPEGFLVMLKRKITEINLELLRDRVRAGNSLETIVRRVRSMLNDEGSDADKILRELGVFGLDNKK